MISVITPSKNIIDNGREFYFHLMMKSLYGQTFRDFEHIVIDSDSNDGTLKLLNDYKKNGWIDTLVSEKDKNVNEAMNKGIKIARRPYIHIMNTDNFYLYSDFFEVSIKKIEGKKADFTHADRIIIPKYEGEVSVKKGDERLAFFRMPFRHETMFIRKKVYDQIGLHDEKYDIAADYKFAIEMLLAGYKGYYMPKSFICTLSGGISSDREKCIKEVSLVLYETYGKKYGLTLKDCTSIYIRNISPDLYSKILAKVKDKRIIKSLRYCYEAFNEFHQP